MEILILYSGGLDSLIMKKYAEKKHPDADVRMVYFDIGHEYAHKEKAVLPEEVEIIDMTWFSATGVGKDGNNSGSIFIPGRNLMFIVNAACKYLPDKIWLGALQGEMHDAATDKNIRFKTQLTSLLNYVLSPFKDRIDVEFPLAEAGWGKKGATEFALSNGLKDEILKSSSCMSGESGACGQCVVCARRWGIFKQLGLEETYNTNPLDSNDNLRMFIEMTETELDSSKEVHYDEYRREEIIPALRMEFKTNDLKEILKILQDRHDKNQRD